MNDKEILNAVALVHGTLVVAVALAAFAIGSSAASILAGGAAIGAFFLLLWGAVGSMARGEGSGWLTGLTTFKISAYVLLAAGLFGRIELDAIGFALGVTCFVGATVVVALRHGKKEAWNTGSFGSNASPS